MVWEREKPHEDASDSPKYQAFWIFIFQPQPRVQGPGEIYSYMVSEFHEQLSIFKHILSRLDCDYINFPAKLREVPGESLGANGPRARIRGKRIADH